MGAFIRFILLTLSSWGLFEVTSNIIEGKETFSPNPIDPTPIVDTTSTSPSILNYVLLIALSTLLIYLVLSFFKNKK